MSADKNIPDVVLRVVSKKFDCIPVTEEKRVDCILNKCMKFVDWFVAVDIKRPVKVDPTVLK